MLTATEFATAIATNDIVEIARHLAASAIASAYENGGGEREAAERLDDWTRASDIAGCSAVAALADRDIKSAARLAVAMVEGRA